MSLIATNPFALCTYAPCWTMLQKRQSSRRFGKDSLLRHACTAHLDEAADGCIDEPRRVVVSIAAARTVDEHGVDCADLLLPAPEAELVRERTQPAAALLLRRG